MLRSWLSDVWSILLAAVPLIVGLALFVLRINPDDLSRNATGWKKSFQKFIVWLGSRRWPQYVGAFFLYGAGIVVGLWLGPKFTQSVHFGFEEAYQTFERRLGTPLRKAELADNVYQAAFDNAIVLWVKPLRSIFALPYNPKKEIVVHLDADWGFDLQLFDQEYLNSVFHPPQAKLTPNGGVAHAWLSDPDRWKWIGWRSWQCTLLNSVYYQEFQNGKILGILRASSSGHEGQIYAILNDGTWQLFGSTNKPADCR